MNIEKKKSAILLVEFQNQWTDKGLYHEGYPADLTPAFHAGTSIKNS